MASVPAELKYTKEHEWAKREGDRVRVGITEYAQEQLGDVVFVELPKVGAKVTAHKAFGVVDEGKLHAEGRACRERRRLRCRAERPRERR